MYYYSSNRDLWYVERKVVEWTRATKWLKLFCVHHLTNSCVRKDMWAFTFTWLNTTDRQIVSRDQATGVCVCDVNTANHQRTGQRTSKYVLFLVVLSSSSYIKSRDQVRSVRVTTHKKKHIKLGTLPAAAQPWYWRKYILDRHENPLLMEDKTAFPKHFKQYIWWAIKERHSIHHPLKAATNHSGSSNVKQPQWIPWYLTETTNNLDLPCSEPLLTASAVRLVYPQNPANNCLRHNHQQRHRTKDRQRNEARKMVSAFHHQSPARLYQCKCHPKGTWIPC